MIKASAGNTGGAMTIVEITEPPHAAGPLHVHHNEDEGFWLLEGSATFEVGGRTIEAAAGDYLFGPRQVPHRYTVGADGSGCSSSSRRGFRGLLRATSRPAETRTLPPADLAPPDSEDLERMEAAIRAHGCELR